MRYLLLASTVSICAFTGCDGPQESNAAANRTAYVEPTPVTPDTTTPQAMSPTVVVAETSAQDPEPPMIESPIDDPAPMEVPAEVVTTPVPEVVTPAVTPTPVKREVVYPNFDDPMDTVETLLRAMRRRDVDVMSQCFAARTEEVFMPMKLGTVTEPMLDVWEDVGNSAYVDQVKSKSFHMHRIEVQMPTMGGAHIMEVMRTKDGWKIGGI